jgi:carbon storage regulator
MLILTRRSGESIIIEAPNGERIEVAVLRLKGNQVQIGTAAAADVIIRRAELSVSNNRD